MSKYFESFIKWVKRHKIFASIIVIIGLIGSSIGIYDYLTKPKFTGTLRTFYGDTKIVWGTNTITGIPDILVVGGNPIFTATIKNYKLFISIIIFDRDGKIVAYIEKNKWEINRNNYFKMDVSQSEIKVINQYGEVSLHCTALHDGSVRVNGIFYLDGLKIIATDNGTMFDRIDS